METNFVELNLNLKILRDDFKYLTYHRLQHMIYKPEPEKSLHPELLSFFKSINVKTKVLLFKTPPKMKSAIHSDGIPYGLITNNRDCAINWVWGAEDHIMCWWKEKSNNVNIDNRLTERANHRNAKDTHSSVSSVEYLNWNIDQVDLIQSVKITKPSLVKIGIPHSVENFSNTDRWCLSIRMIVPPSKVTWDKSLKLFKEYIINEPIV